MSAFSPAKSLKKSAENPDLAGLGSLGVKAYHHWKEHLPSLFQARQKDGSLHRSLKEAEDNANQAISETAKALEKKGYSRQQAEESAQEIHLPQFILLNPDDQGSETSS